MRAEDVLDSLCPHDWLRVRAKHVFANSTERARHDDTQLSASQRLGVVPQAYLMAEENQKYMLALSGTDNFKHVEIGDFIISLRSFEGGFEYSAYQGCVSPAYTVLRPRFEINSSYWKNLFKSSVFRQIIAAFNVGVRDGKSIRYDDFSDFILAIPPLALQTTISGFLDRETTRIDALIAKKTRFIELLREKRQALITQAVTKGLDPHVQLKDSGVEWLGEVPEHWEVVRVKHITPFITSGPRGWSDFIDDNGNEIFLQSGELNDSLQILPHKAKRISPPQGAEGNRTKLQENDIVICITGANTGRVAIVGELLATTYINQHLCLIRPDLTRMLSKFLGLLLSSEFGRTYFDVMQYGLKEGLSLSNIADAPLAIPPINEQVQICAYLDNETIRLDALITKTQQSIDLLKERRSALITAAVTGQIDVREDITDYGYAKR